MYQPWVDKFIVLSEFVEFLYNMVRKEPWDGDDLNFVGPSRLMLQSVLQKGPGQNWWSGRKGGGGVGGGKECVVAMERSL